MFLAIVCGKRLVAHGATMDEMSKRHQETRALCDIKLTWQTAITEWRRQVITQIAFDVTYIFTYMRQPNDVTAKETMNH